MKLVVIKKQFLSSLKYLSLGSACHHWNCHNIVGTVVCSELRNVASTVQQNKITQSHSSQKTFGDNYLHCFATSDICADDQSWKMQLL